MTEKRAVITYVRPGSIAAEMGICPGDILLTVNGEQVTDFIVYRYLTADENLEVEVAKPDGERWILEIEKDYGEDLGLEFASATFDGLRRCRNKCIFCFVDQMPLGLRSSLYVKDDDFRYSFLHGNFITLTNLKPEDWDYIFRWHISPLYISVHTTNPLLRNKLLGNPRAGEIMTQLKRLAAAGIVMHTQIVLCPGLNDGPELERTIKDLGGLFPAVQSIAVVPVGLTSSRKHLYPLRRVTPEEATAIIDQIEVWQASFRRRYGCGLVYGADEFYLLAGLPLPPAAYYDEFPQVENGVGLTRLFLDDFDAALAHAEPRPDGPRRIAIATGTLAAPLLKELLPKIKAKAGELELMVVPVTNHFFGPEVTVAGLLTGRDLIEGLKGTVSWLRGEEGWVLIPDVMLKREALIFLDDLTPEVVARELGVKVEVVPTNGKGLMAGCCGIEMEESFCPNQ
ncbi:hypothetical protein MHLNE_14000 [Moorella humiferrea]|uniref:DUF512 domain-containing protein n=1 Tax=Neomoorella humiferrea TaxID=676965 RepID=UPI0030CE75F2